MSIYGAAAAIRERANQERADRVQRAILSNAVGDLAAQAAVAKSRIATAKSAGRHWRQATTLAGVITELANLQRQIDGAPPARRGEFLAANRAINELMTDAWVALRGATGDEFGGFAADPVKLANAVLGAEKQAQPKAKRSAKVDGRVPIADAFAASMRKQKETRLWVTTADGEVIGEITGTEKDKLLAAKAKRTGSGPIFGNKPKGKKVSTVDGAIKRVMTKGSGSPKVVATASSTAVDLERDTFALSALKQMANYYPGRLAFVNHSYNLPADLFGVIEKATIVKRGDRHDLDVLIAVETGNPLAMQTLEYIKGGTKLGVSVGVLVDHSEQQKDGTTLIDDIRPLELSVVGIPSNQTAWTQGSD